MNPWRKFWGQNHRIYVNDRHRAVHYRQVADDLLSVLPPRPEPAVLDYGCGDAFDASRVAARAGHLYLFDAVPEVVARLRQRFADHKAIAVVDEAQLAALPPASIDLAIINSVVQYLKAPELDAALGSIRRLLRDDGTLIVADVIPPDVGAIDDVSALLRSAARHGFLAGALVGLAATFFSDYRHLRQSAGLATYTEADFLAMLRQAGFAAERRPRNFGFNAKRMTFVARPRPQTARP
jgi:ubiquinone/menaquinone biosynthesis C-methylase UbiE